MLHVAKTSLSSYCMGFRQGRRSPEAEKKSFPPTPFQKTLRLAKQRFSPASPLQVITSPPPHRFGRFFAFPIPCLVSDLMFIICLFMQLRNIKRRGYAVFQPSLPYFALRFTFSHPIFVRNQSLIPYLFQSTQHQALLNMFQASKSSCGFASTLL